MMKEEEGQVTSDGVAEEIIPEAAFDTELQDSELDTVAGGVGFRHLKSSPAKLEPAKLGVTFEFDSNG